MKTKHEKGNSNARPETSTEPGGQVLVIGGNGGLTSHYRAVVEEKGLSLRHFEKKIPAAARHGVGHIVLVVVMVTMVSHALRDHAREIAGNAKIVYLKSPSISALRAAVNEAS